MTDIKNDESRNNEMASRLYDDIFEFLSYAVHDDDIDKEFMGRAYPDLESISEIFEEFYNTGYFRMGFRAKAEKLDQRISKFKLGEKHRRVQEQQKAALKEAEEHSLPSMVKTYMNRAVRDLNTTWEAIGEEIKASAAPGGTIQDAISVFIEDSGFGAYTSEEVMDALASIYGVDSPEMQDIKGKNPSEAKKLYVDLLQKYFLDAYSAATGKNLLEEE